MVVVSLGRWRATDLAFAAALPFALRPPVTGAAPRTVPFVIIRLFRDISGEAHQGVLVMALATPALPAIILGPLTIKFFF